MIILINNAAPMYLPAAWEPVHSCHRTEGHTCTAGHTRGRNDCVSSNRIRAGHILRTGPSNAGLQKHGG